MKRTRSARPSKYTRLLARSAAEAERREDAQARKILDSQAFARIQDLLAPDDCAPLALRTPLRAMLIINSKSGPAHDSLLHVRELVDLLARHGIAADVRVKLHKSQARRVARDAARTGYRLVVAAGGDGTVAAVARGLVGSKAVLGIIPLGTYNNFATSLGIPTDVAQACALIALAPAREIDVGEVHARGMRRPRVFLEVGAVGIAAPLVSAGQSFEKGRWDDFTRHLPDALDMSPTILGVRIDGRGQVARAQSLLVVVANTPRAGAGLVLAPEAKVDDGLLNVHVYEEMTQVTLAAHFLAVKGGIASADARVQSRTGQSVVIHSKVPLPVAVDSKVVGSTPARFRVLTGRLRVIAGTGDALTHPVAESLLAAITDPATAPLPLGGGKDLAPVSVSMAAPGAASTRLTRHAEVVGVALITGTAAALVPAVFRWVAGRLR
jgi:YegS/Rv2252/BmrU family lipid kinase